MVMQAYNGFVAYPSLFHAGCLKNEDTGNYCFADAATNTSSPTSSYVYYLPLGINLPSTTKPKCSSCLQNTMAIFANTASNKSQPLHDNYISAAQLIDSNCGNNFVNASIPASTGAAAVSHPSLTGLGSIALVVALLTILF
ncbi:hypothetical protein H2203_006650 [Taxawa tesnikishii (nom. ined.)]|nr:hypothetical protein H2203_006650 [Dothideales sp. JES 119]